MSNDIFEMSDEEVSNLAPEDFSEENNSDEEEVNQEEGEEEHTEASEDVEEESTPEEEEDEGSEEAEEEDFEEETEDTSEEESDSGESEEPEVSLEEYKKLYETVYAPFKANGKMIKASSPEDIINLMKMGAGFHKKMANIKGIMPLVKMLEKNGITDPEDLNYLIDLKEKNPEAIAKLVQDSEIDLYDFEPEKKASSYKPTDRTISQQDIALEEVLSDIVESPNYNRTVDVLGNQWDEVSRKIILEKPEIIRFINEHMDNDLYDRIWEEVENQRQFGRLENMSDLEAYHHVGESLFGKPDVPQEHTAPPKTTSKQKQRVSAGTKSGRGRSNPPGDLTSTDIMNMSDEELMKIGDSRFL